ncbi:hypothetical protein TrCOL_g6110 [Triparma columacea]|uniref:Uncharacterized protein n=1 Tax=Triparma columacea TaxID=722753 RepID=A0A9W7GP09_9STRA|nr:hypothetical protein TrCOL_g6110 [Triparma columacea]
MVWRHGHAHNDYEQEEPLRSALRAGIRSIEVDVFPPTFSRKSGFPIRSEAPSRCLVAHTKWGVSNDKDIVDLYVEPLREYLNSLVAGRGDNVRRRYKIVRFLSHLKDARLEGVTNTNGGAMPEGVRPVNLLIDIKRSPKTVLPVLLDNLRPLREWMTTYDEKGNVKEGLIKVVLSGDLGAVKGEMERYFVKKECGRLDCKDEFGGEGRMLPNLEGAGKEGVFFIDGRVSDLKRGRRGGKQVRIEPTTVDEQGLSIPCISFNYKGLLYSSIIRGKTRNRRIEEITRKAHSEGKRVRAFALPNSEGAWEDALRNGVDIISVDDHQGFREFCKKKSQREKEGFF